MPAFRRIAGLAALLLSLCLSIPAQAQQGANHINAQLVLEGPVSPGSNVDAAILMKPDVGWHGYWSNPGDAGYGMELGWSLPQGWQAGDLQYPVPQTLLISGLMNHVYEGEYAVLVPITVPEDAALGAQLAVTIEAQWLACTDQICVPERAMLAATFTVGGDGARDPRFDTWRAALPPLIDSKGRFEVYDSLVRVGIPLPASLEIANPHLFLNNQEFVDYAAVQDFWRDGDMVVVELDRKTGSDTMPDVVSGILKLDNLGNGVSFTSAQGEVTQGGTPLDFDPAQAHDIAPLWSLLILALAGGLLLNIMPCVFPILSLKALSLARAGESASEARREGLAYTGGVVLALLALGGLLLALRAGGAQIGWAFQLQEPGVVVFLLALVCIITANFAGLFELPSLSFTRGGQPMGAFGTGLLAAFVATPCTGPFMAAAMGGALLLPVFEGLLLFGVLGLGLALPFLVLGFIPALRKLLPRPGPWMETFRRVMAVPMGLTALALLWLTWRVGGADFAIYAGGLMVPLITVLVTVGRLQRTGRGSRSLVLASGGALLAAALLVLPRVLNPPAQSESEVIAAENYTAAGLAEARASGQPVFLWFTADWCLTCKVNESLAIEREATRDAFEKAGVIAIRGDWTRRDPEITRFLTANGAAGIPLYLWYPAGGQGEQLPQVLTPDSLITLASGD